MKGISQNIIVSKRNRLGVVIVSTMAAFIYFLSPYKLFGVPADQLMCLVAGVIAFISTYRFRLPQGYGLFFLYMIIVPAFVTIAMGFKGELRSTLLPTTLLIFTFSISTIIYALDKRTFLKAYRFLVYLSIGFAFIQTLALAVNIKILLYLPLESVYGGDPYEYASNMTRPHSFFCEPAHFGCFLAPYLCYEVGKFIERKKISFDLIIILFGYFIARSGSAMLMLIAVSTYTFLKFKISFFAKVVLTICMIIIAILCIGYILNSEYGAYVSGRLDELSGERGTFQTSGYVRIFRGYLVYEILPTINKIFGTGVGAVSSIIDSDPMLSYIFSQQTGNRFNGLQQMLIQGGIIGTVLFFRFVRSFFKSKNESANLCMIAMSVYMLLEATYLNPRMFIFFLMAYAMLIRSKESANNLQSKLSFTQIPTGR